MRPVTVTVVGADTSDPIRVNYRQPNFKVGIGCSIVSGAVSYTVQHSFDGTNWFNNTDLVTETTAGDTSYLFPVQYIRLVNADTGTVSMTLLQGQSTKREQDSL